MILIFRKIYDEINDLKLYIHHNNKKNLTSILPSYWKSKSIGDVN